jgi:hypothetical protein
MCHCCSQKMDLYYTVWRHIPECIMMSKVFAVRTSNIAQKSCIAVEMYTDVYPKGQTMYGYV